MYRRFYIIKVDQPHGAYKKTRADQWVLRQIRSTCAMMYFYNIFHIYISFYKYNVKTISKNSSNNIIVKLKLIPYFFVGV